MRGNPQLLITNFPISSLLVLISTNSLRVSFQATNFILTLGMDNIDNMVVTFKNVAQRQCYATVFQREVARTKYPDGHTIATLGLGESINLMFNQLGWKSFTRKKLSTCHKLTLEFLKSFLYDPNQGRGFNRGRVSFRSFGYTYNFNHREMDDLLGLPNGPDVFTITQEDASMTRELDYLWTKISGDTRTEPDSRHSSQIHNPAICYFHMVLAYTLFGKPESNTIVSRDELFILFCVFHSMPVNVETFMLANLDRIAHATHGSILIGGQVTMIVAALALRTALSRITPLGGIRPMDITFCFNRILIRNLGPREFQLLIIHEVVHQFTLPNIERTSVHDRNNWLYDL